MPGALLTQRVQTSCHERLIQPNLQAQQISHFTGQVLYNRAHAFTAQRVTRCHIRCRLANVHWCHLPDTLCVRAHHGVSWWAASTPASSAAAYTPNKVVCAESEGLRDGGLSKQGAVRQWEGAQAPLSGGAAAAIQTAGHKQTQLSLGKLLGKLLEDEGHRWHVPQDAAPVEYVAHKQCLLRAPNTLAAGNLMQEASHNAQSLARADCARRRVGAEKTFK